MGDELHYLELHEVAHLIQTRKLSPVEITQAILTRIERLDPRLRSFAKVTGEDALRYARKAEADIAQRRYKGPLHGVPVALKDLCYTKDVVTSAGTPVFKHFVPAFNGTVVERLYAAGAISVGKLQLTEG